MSQVDRHVQQTGFSPVAPDDEVQYRPISRRAIAALVCGLLSALGLFTPAMWWLPVVALVLAIGALRSIRRSEGQMIGRKAAIAAIVAALFFGAVGPTRYMLRQHWIFQQATLYTRQWIELIRAGELHDAHQLMLTQENRVSPGQDVKELYDSNKNVRDDMTMRFDNEPLKSIIELGEKGQLRKVRNVGIRRETRGARTVDIVLQQFAIDYHDDGPETLSFVIEIERDHHSDINETRWRIYDLVQPDSSRT